MPKAATIRLLLFALVLLASSHAGFAQIGISVSFGPPAIPIYEQPICPGDGYIWTPGFWDYDDEDGYYWVPGTWVEAPQPGYLWTPGYWGWGGSGYIFHDGYWGEHVGFYGGINYGYGYGGRGYEGGRWDRGRFYYNTSVNRVNVTIIHNTYNTRVVENRTRVSYNGGRGGISSRASAQEESYGRERHIERVSAQQQHIEQARSNPALRATTNRGRPPIAATQRPTEFGNGAVAARKAGGSYKAPPASASRPSTSGNRPPTGGQPANTARPATTGGPGNELRPNTNGHAGGLQSHTYAPPPTSGNAARDQKFQQQRDQLAARQNQEHQRLQQQQSKQDDQLTRKNADDARRQQLEQRHTQQTQHLEQKHTTQEQHIEQHQQPRGNAAKPAENHSEGGRPH